MKILGTNIKDEYVWIGGALLGAAGLYWFSMANGRPGIQLTGADTRRAYPAMACSNGHCIESDDDNVGIQCVNGVCTKTEGGSSMTQTSEDGSTFTSTDPQVAQDMIARINRQIRRQQHEITDEATGNFARAYPGQEVGGGGMGGGAGGANGLGDINNDFMAQLEAMIQQAVADGMASGAGSGEDGVGSTGANANGLPSLDANGMSSHGGRGGHGGITGPGGAGGIAIGGGHARGGMGGHARGGAGGGGGGWGGRRKKRGGMGGAGGGGGWGKKKGGMGAGGHGGAHAGKAKGGATADCTDPNNAALPECANADTSATDSGFAMAYAGTMNNYAYQGDADDIDEYYDSYRGSMEEMDSPDENDYLKSYNTGNTFELNMPTNPMSSAAYGNTRYDQMTPWKVVSA